MESGSESRLTHRVRLGVPDRLFPFESSGVVVRFVGRRSVEVDVEPECRERAEGSVEVVRETRRKEERTSHVAIP